MLVGGMGLRLAGGYFYLEWFQAVSLLLMLAGATLILGGWLALRWAWLSIAFLIFMMPLPHRAEVALARPLQRVAALGSTYVLQVLGLPALAEGNVILVNDSRIGIVEACNGLGMLLVFFALATGVVILVQRHWLEKILLIASAAPIAVVVNVLRISVTGILYETSGRYWADLVFHDLAGWLMMPVALILIALELQLFNRLFVEPSTAPTKADGPAALALEAVQPKPLPQLRRQASPAPALKAGPPK
jgi:exosortase